MAELVILEVALGFAYNKLLEAVDHAKHGLCMSDSVLSDLKRTVNRLKPKIDEIVWLNQRLGQNSSDKEIRELLLRAEQIVNKCLEVAWWKFWKKYAYRKKLRSLDFSLRRMIEIDLQFDQRIAIMQISKQVMELRRSVSTTMREGKSGRRIFGRSQTRVLRMVSSVKRSAISMQNWFFVFLVSIFSVKNWGYEKLTSRFCQA